MSGAMVGSRGSDLAGELMYQRFILLLLMAIMLFVPGCGFHLRGFVPLSAMMAEPYLEGSDAALISRLEEALRSLGANPVTEKAAASAVIEFTQIRYQREVGTLDVRGVVVGYVLKYEVLYRVMNSGGEVLTEQSRLILSRNLDYDSGQVLQLEQEEALLREAMLDELVERILARLMALKANGSLSSLSPTPWLRFDPTWS
jgi:LPS-assembly lipoprotein